MCGMCREDGETIYGMDDQGDEERVAQNEGSRSRKCSLFLHQPTQSQYRDHCTTHFPYQSWCPSCLKAEGKNLDISDE